MPCDLIWRGGRIVKTQASDSKGTLVESCSMADMFTPKRRSEIMRNIRSKDTKPEMTVRRIVHRLGFRFRLHGKDLPGTPDLVLPKYCCVVFVNGCYWHGHTCKRGYRTPGTNADYWTKKIGRNIEQQEMAFSQLLSDGWKVVLIWECEIKDLCALADRLKCGIKGPVLFTEY